MLIIFIAYREIYNYLSIIYVMCGKAQNFYYQQHQSFSLWKYPVILIKNYREYKKKHISAFYQVSKEFLKKKTIEQFFWDV